MRSKKSRRDVRSLQPVLHIFCEGEKTEPNYLNRYKDLYSLGKAICIEKTPKNTPVQLVQAAIVHKKFNKAFASDEYWVVYDRESPIKYDETLHAQARSLAQANGIHIAISNVCFEVWLLLHKQPNCAPCNTCDELIHRADFRAAFPGYNKGDGCVLSRAEMEIARRNAVAMNRRTIAGADPSWTVPSKWNPYTDMYCLLDAIDAFALKNKGGW